MTAETITAWSGHLAYALVLISFLARNMIHLRVLSIAASFAAMYYATFVAGGPLWIPIAWNVLFIGVNAWRTSSLLWQHREQSLTDDERFLARTALKAFPRWELKTFLDLARRRPFAPGEVLIEKGTTPRELFLISQGSVSVAVTDHEIARLSAGSFVGEMSFISHEEARADVKGATAGEVLGWSHEVLKSWSDLDPQRSALLQAALGTQVIELLMKKSV